MDFITAEIIPFIKNHPIIILAWVVLFAVILYMSFKIRFSKVKFISNAQTIHFMNKLNGIVVDLRSADNFKRGHITEAYNILPVDINNGSIKAIEKFKESPIVVLDDNGLTATKAGETLIKQGFTQVYALKDGMAGWNGENLPLTKK